MPLRLMGEKDIDVIVCGEIAELLLGTYMQDAASLGLPRSMIVLGHERSEEWGMQLMQSWLSQEVSVPCISSTQRNRSSICNEIT